MTHFCRSLTGFLAASVVLCAMSPALGATTLSRITDITIDNQGNLVLNVEGEGFDPLLHLESPTSKTYRVVLQADSTAAVDVLQTRLNASLAQWQKDLPALESVHLQAQQANGLPQTTVYLDVSQKLLPQIRSNTGSQIVIALVGNHGAPASVTQAEISAKGKISEAPPTVKKARFAAIRQLQETSAATDLDLAWDSHHRSEPQKAKQARTGTSLMAQKAQAAASIKLANAVTDDSSKLLLASGSLDIDPLLLAQKSRKSGLALLEQSSATATDVGEVVTLALAEPSAVSSTSSDSTAEPQTGTATKSTPIRHYLMLAQSAGPQFLAKPTEDAGQQLEQEKSSELTPSNPLQLKQTPPDFEIEDAASDALDKSRNEKSSVRVTARRTRLDPSLYAVIANADTDPALRTAWDSLMNGQSAQAEKQLRAYLEQDPANAAARFLLARILLMPQIGELSAATANERRDEARKQLAMAIARNVHGPSFVDLIELTLEDDKIPVAERLWDRLHGWQPDDSMTYYAHGRILEAKDDIGGARDTYKSALAQQPDNPAFHYRLAQVELKAGRLDAAWWELSQALMVYPDDGRLWKQMAFLAEKRNQPQQALKYYKQSIPTDALLSYGHLLAAENQPDKALLYYSAAEDLAGDDIDVLFTLGMGYADLKRNDRAEKTLTRFLALNQDTQDSRIGSAKAMLMKVKAPPKPAVKTQEPAKTKPVNKARRGQYRYYRYRYSR